MSAARDRSSERIGPAPARPRILARVRRSTLFVLVAVISTAYAASWAAPSSALRWIGFAALVALAYVVARRSTRVVEDLFEQEDRLMLAVAHEVRGPLSTLLVSLEEGASGTAPAEVAIKDATTDGVALSELIDDLIETARVMSGASARPDEAVRVDEVARSVAALSSHGDAQVVTDLRPGLVVGSPRLVRLAVSNLIRNSARHGYENGPGTIVVRTDEAGIHVRDDGGGIPEERLAELRRDIPRGLRRARSGLGLALAGWVAEVHGGRLELENRARGGFEARLVLPVQPTDAAGRPAGQPNANPRKDT